MGDQDDKAFLKRFSGIIVGLVIVTILIIIISVGNKRLEPGTNPSRAALAIERVAPVGSVRTELPAEQAVEPQTQVAPVVTELAETEPQMAQEQASEAGIDGAAIYASACMACHAAGVAGAPVPGSDGWAERAAKGADTLVANAIAGIGPIMQPKGGRADLSDDEVKAAVDHMLAQ